MSVSSAASRALPRPALLVLVLAGASLSALAATADWTLDDPEDLSYDPDDVVVADGVARLFDAAAGTGLDGDLALSGETFDLSTDTTAGRTVADGAAWPCTWTADGEASLEDYAGGLDVSDELLLWTPQVSDAGDAVGAWTTGRVTAVSDDGTATLTATPDDGAGSGVCQRIPNYAAVDLEDATVTAAAWDGSTGGVVAFRARDGLTVDAGSAIDADGLGFRGGAGGSASGGGGEGGECWVTTDHDGGDVDLAGDPGGGAGEGIASGSGLLTAAGGGYCAGGGGADGTDNADDGAGGGGGGGHAGGGGGGGGGTGCGASAAGDGGAGGTLDEDAGGGGVSHCPGGDGGTDGADGGKISGYSCGTSFVGGEGGDGWVGGGGGDTCGSNFGGGGGGGGGRAGDDLLSDLFFGGGGAGGGGSSYGYAGGDGGAGGGVVLLWASEADVAGTVTAAGEEGATTSTSYRSASGGSGAGGTVRLSAGELTLSGSLSATGGDVVEPGTYIAGGGGGGDGRIRVLADEVNGVSADDDGFAAEVAAWATVEVGDASDSEGGYPLQSEVCAVETAAPTAPFVWTGFSADEDADGGEVTWTLVDGDGDAWWWDGSAWTVSGTAEDATDAATVDANVAELTWEEAGWCAVLSGDGTQAVGIDEVRLSWDADSDEDRVGDSTDNCVDVDNPDQDDADADGQGDACDECTDVDDDGYGDASYDATTCDEDCDDADPTVNPGATETWYDGVDQDCDGNDSDADEDGFDAEVVGGDDCDDADPAVFPGATDTWYDGVDSDCAGDDDYDADVDGYTVDEDCDDADPALNPGAEEVWYDGVDQDCDGNDSDADGDGFDAAVVGGEDCDDADPALNPGAEETWYDGVDQDCDGNDSDADGDGADAFEVGGDDCDDSDPDVVADGYDEDCEELSEDTGEPTDTGEPPEDTGTPPEDTGTPDEGEDPVDADPGKVLGGCVGCAAAPTTPAPWLGLLALLGLALRRRRDPSG